MLIDLYPDLGASIIASVNISRCILSAVIVAVTQYIIDGIGTGWTFTLYSLVALVCPIPVTFLLVRFGPRWQEKRETRHASSY